MPRTMSIAAKRRFTGLMFALPAMAFFAVFMVYPLTTAIWWSFTDWDLFSDPRFIGLRNYFALFQSEEFLNSLRVTVIYVVGVCPVLLVLSLAAALTLNRQHPYVQGMRVVYFLPHLMSLVVASIVWRYIFHPTHGLYTYITRPLGIPDINWLTTGSYALAAIIIVAIWRMIGYYMMIFLAGLQNISQELYESAEIDGANGWQKLIYITVPLLKPTLTFVSVVAIIFAFQALIPAMMMTSGGPAGATNVLMLYMYDNAFKFFRMGRASAVAVLMMLVLLILSFIQLKLSNRGEKA